MYVSLSIFSPVIAKCNDEIAIAEGIRGLLASKDPPSDGVISTWPKRSDPDDWLDIDYVEFEQNLQGKSGKDNLGTSAQSSGYGHKAAEENLKKMVERFERFLNDETADVDGISLGEDMDEDMDEDVDEDVDEDSVDENNDEDEDEDKGVSFDEAEFERMMREMMGLPPDQQCTNDNVEDEGQEIRKVMDQVKVELEEAGVIDCPELPWVKRQKEGNTEFVEGEEDDGGDLNIDFNLAKNLLESFKSQAGMAGPGGNLLASMGIVLPRDEGEELKGKGREND